MGKKEIDPELKVRLVERYLNCEIGLREAARLAGLGSTSPFDKWVFIYKQEGPSGLMTSHQKKTYSPDTKLAAVQAFLNGEGSIEEISIRFGLRSIDLLSSWVRVYNAHGEFSYGSGGSKMSKPRTTSFEERIEIVQDCLSNGRKFNETALKYQCSYQQVRNWVFRYESMGSAGLEDRRGKRIGMQPARTPEEELRNKIAELERRNNALQMENDLLKKVRELEMKDRYL